MNVNYGQVRVIGVVTFEVAYEGHAPEIVALVCPDLTEAGSHRWLVPIPRESWVVKAIAGKEALAQCTYAQEVEGVVRVDCPGVIKEVKGVHKVNGLRRSVSFEEFVKENYRKEKKISTKNDLAGEKKNHNEKQCR